MNKSIQTQKPIGELNLADFRRYPIWTLYESDYDESQVIPVEISCPLNIAEYSMLFILCELLLNDGTVFEGVISISLHNRIVYFIEFIKDEHIFRYGGMRDPVSESVDNLIKWLGKTSVEQVSPIKYRTQYFFDENSPIEGQIDIGTW